MPPARRRPPGTRTPPPTPPHSRRADVERRSKLALAYLHGLPRWLPFLAVLAIGLVGVLAPAPVSGVALLVVAVFLGWLGYVSWPALTPPARLLRVAAVALVVYAGVLSLE